MTTSAPPRRPRPGGRRARRDLRGAGRDRLAPIARTALLLAAVTFALALFQPFASDGGRAVTVVVPPRAGAGTVGDILDKSGVVPNGKLFELRAALGGDRGDLKPGRYRLREDMSYSAVLDRLVAGPPADVVRLTIPEGLSRTEIARLVRKAGLRGDYLDVTRTASALDPRSFGLSRRPETLEGFLFPATYELKPGAPVGSLVSKQLAAFEQRFAGVGLSYSRRKNLTAYDVLTIASMVEREARVAKERPLIAAVIYNRLRQGQPLGIDATIRFATGNWDTPLTRSQLAIDSPYNTRLKAGLPPGPIGNPGLDSIIAAAHPARVGYTYFVVKPGSCGEHAFSSSFEQFSRDRERYQSARALAGGRSPTDCP